MSRSVLAPAALVLALGSAFGCAKPEDSDPRYSRYRFDLEINRNAAGDGFACIASVTDQINQSTLRTAPFSARAGRSASTVVEDAPSGTRLEVTIKVDSEARRATYTAKLAQSGQRTVTFESTRDIPK